MYSRLAFSFHDQAFNRVVFESSRIVQGPFSPSAALVDGTPGPPESHIDNGADEGFFRASKNQKYMWLS